MSNRALTEAEANNRNDKISFIFIKYKFVPVCLHACILVNVFHLACIPGCVSTYGCWIEPLDHKSVEPLSHIALPVPTGCCVSCGMYSSLWLKIFCPNAF